jgi:CBS domain-containing protein
MRAGGAAASMPAMPTSQLPRLAHVRVSDAMHYGVLTCAPDTPLAHVARTMAEHRVHCVVIQESDKPGPSSWSVVSDRDLMAAAAADRVDDTTAAAVAATSVRWVGSGEPLSRAAQVMAENDISHLIVVDEASGRPNGILSTLDVAMVLAAERQ